MNDSKTAETVRTASNDDVTALRELWSSSFDDDIAFVDAFFLRCFEPRRTVTAVLDGVPVSAGYLLPAGELIPGTDGTFPCAMIYGVATLPEYRGRGLAALVTRELTALALREGFRAVVLTPASDTLFNYYRTRADFADFFYTREYRLKACEMPPHSGSEIRRVSAAEYAALREKQLAGVPHIKISNLLLELQNDLCEMCSGGFFADASGCGVAERQRSGAVLLRELIAPPDAQNELLAAIAAALPAPEYLIRTPAVTINEPQSRRLGMLWLPPGITVPDGTGWLGMTFD